MEGDYLQMLTTEEVCVKLNIALVDELTRKKA